MQHNKISNLIQLSYQFIVMKWTALILHWKNGEKEFKRSHKIHCFLTGKTGVITLSGVQSDEESTEKTLLVVTVSNAGISLHS